MAILMQGSGNITCSSCGTVNEPGSSFCKNCGNRMEDSVRYCQSCGKQLPKTSVALCPACGAVVGGQRSGPPAPVRAETAGSQAQGHAAYNANLPPDSRFVVIPPSEADFAALRKMKLFGLIGIIELVFTIILFSTIGLNFSSFFGKSGMFVIGGITVAYVAVIIAELVLEIYSIFLVWSAFRILSTTDSRFSTPAKLVTLMIAGSLLAVGLVLILAVPGIFSLVTALVILIAVLVVLVVFLLLGLIGLLIGIWRLGTRYRDSSFKVAAVMYLIPFLSVVGAILVYASSSSLIKRFERK